MEVKYVEANGLRFAYFEEGPGPTGGEERPLVLAFHGFPDTPSSWDDVRPHIAEKGYRVVTPYMRGYRPSAIPPRDADQETLSRDALALIPALGAERAILIGHDWGASTVYAAAQLEPERVDKVIALAIPLPASLRPTPRKMWGVRHFIAYKLPGAARRFAADDFAALRHIYKRWSPTWDPSDEELAPVRACFEDRESLEAALGYYRALSFRIPRYARAKIAVPTVAFGGLDDPMAEVDDYENARRWFTGEYTIEMMPGGHFMHREHPAEFRALLLQHL